jgi:hypothetical protein
MFLQEGHKTNYLKLSISLVLSILFTYNSWCGVMSTYDFVHPSGLSPFGANSYVYVCGPQSSTINSWISILNFSKFNIFNNTHKESVQTRLLNQIITISEKIKVTKSIIKPPGFCNYFSKRETDDVPVLS